MTFDPAWHAEYARRETAMGVAREEMRAARRIAERRRPPAGAQAAYEAAFATFSAASNARWDFEMAGAVIVDIATLPATEWMQALKELPHEPPPSLPQQSEPARRRVR